MLYSGLPALKQIQRLYWLKGPMLYTGSKALYFIVDQRPRALYWLKGPVFYTGSKALCFILAQRACALYWLKGPGTHGDT